LLQINILDTPSVEKTKQHGRIMYCTHKIQ
jgi:hypothetical protein